jgi:hypothetical protein
MSSQLQVSGEAKIRDIQGPVVANSGVITALDGDASQYVRGDGTLADFPTSTGGGSSVSYYLNSSVSQGTIGGVAYRQLSKTPISGAGTDITASTNGYIASYITDANDPSLLEVPAGNFNCEFYFSVNSNNHNPYVYAELYKYDGTTFTLLGSNQAIPEYLTNGTTLSAYYFAIPVAVAALNITDRLAIRIYVNVDTRTVTLHTENNHLCQVVTTFSKGLTSLNNLTRQVQFLATGTSGTDFNISSSTATHTFNLPVASATNTGKLSSTDWSTFNNKVPYTGATQSVNLGSNSLSASALTVATNLILNSTFLLKKAGLGVTTPTYVSQFAATTGVGIGYSDGTGGGNFILQTAAIYDYTFPAITGTLALLEGTQTFTGEKVFNNNALFNSVLSVNYGAWLQKGVPSATYSSAFTTLYSEVGAINAVFRDNTNQAKLQFQSASNYTYTFPAASGTLALTSNLSSYVPYTGATTNVNLGVYSLTANKLIAGSASTDNVAIFTTYDEGKAIQLKSSTGDLIFVPFFNPSTGARIIAQNTAGSAYTPLSFFASNFYFHSNVNFNSTIGNGTYTYTLPSATGTLALTSNLSAYLPLTGGTLTGALSGTSASFTSNVTATNNVTISSTTNSSLVAATNSTTGYTFIDLINNGASGKNYQIGIGGNGAASGYANNLYFDLVGVGNVMTLTSGRNVGIGTSSPAQKLSVENAGQVFVDIINTSTTADAGIHVKNSTVDTYMGSNNSGGYIYTASNHPILLYTNATERMRITSGGLVLMGLTSNPASARLALDAIGMAVYNGSFYRQCYMDSNIMYWYNGSNQASLTSAGVWTNASDISIKKDIKNIKYGLNEVLKLNPRSYKMNEDDLEQIGFIAQEVEEIIKEVVSTDNKGMKGLSYGNLTAVLVKAIQEQTQIIKDIESRIKQLENK